MIREENPAPIEVMSDDDDDKEQEKEQETEQVKKREKKSWRVANPTVNKGVFIHPSP